MKKLAISLVFVLLTLFTQTQGAFSKGKPMSPNRICASKPLSSYKDPEAAYDACKKECINAGRKPRRGFMCPESIIYKNCPSNCVCDCMAK